MPVVVSGRESTQATARDQYTSLADSGEHVLEHIIYGPGLFVDRNARSELRLSYVCLPGPYRGADHTGVSDLTIDRMAHPTRFELVTSAFGGQGPLTSVA